MVTNSQNIIVFGAGLWSFFQNFGQTCLNTQNCQGQILSIDNESTIWVYSLSTLGVSMQLSILDTGVIPQSQNVNGYQVRDFPSSLTNTVINWPLSLVYRHRVDPVIPRSVITSHCSERAI